MTKRFFTSLALASGCVAGSAALALGPDHAAVESTAKLDGTNVELSFKIVPDKGMHINLEGPWKLELKTHDGLPLAKTTLTKADLQENLPGFVVKTTAAPSKKNGDVEYALTVFVCTEDKTACYREVHNGKTAWDAGAKG